MCIDTVFICFCEDCEMNDGQQRPYFMSRGLMVIPFLIINSTLNLKLVAILKLNPKMCVKIVNYVNVQEFVEKSHKALRRRDRKGRVVAGRDNPGADKTDDPPPYGFQPTAPPLSTYRK